MFKLDTENGEITAKQVETFIRKHRKQIGRLEENKRMYEGDHDILHEPPKEKYKPDNRIVVNYAKYLVDTFNGFFIGIPIKTSHPDDEINEYLTLLNKYNNQDDNNAELSKACSIYGRAYELLYIDEDSNLGITYVSPIECFVIYDNSIRERPICGVRYYRNDEGTIEGSYSDNHYIYYFKFGAKGLEVIDTEAHYFGGVPIIEYVENEERQGIFDNVKSINNALNKAISEKANDVDYYADAYLKIIGAIVDDEALRKLRDHRILNMAMPGETIDIDFLKKPSDDATQENLIDRLSQLIFTVSMVADITDKKFENATGISLKYKLNSMLNLAAVKERKFTAGLNKRYQLISNIPTSKLNQDDWLKINYKFTRNIPTNILEEADIASKLMGICSEETTLSVLSIIQDAKEEMKRKREEEEEATEDNINALYLFNNKTIEDEEEEAEESEQEPEDLFKPNK